MAGPRSLVPLLFLVVNLILIPIPNSAAASVPPEPDAKPVSGSAVIVSADAADNVGVMGVQFLLNGAPLGPEDPSEPYSTVWDTTSVADGTYAVTARARDAAGNATLSPPVTLVVDNGPSPDTTAPSVATTAPSNGSVVSAVVPVRAGAGDDVAVVGVTFLMDGQPLGGEDTSAPWETSWDTTSVPDGTHTLAARARDAAGNMATSAAITVTVANQPTEGTTGDSAPSTSSPDGEPSPSTSSPDAEPPASTSPPDPLPADARLEVSLQADATRETIAIHSASDLAALDHLDLLIDGVIAASSPGNVLDHEWDTRPLVGFHEVRVVGWSGADEPVVSSSVYQIEVDPAAISTAPRGRRRGQTRTASATGSSVVLAVSAPGGGRIRIQGETLLEGVKVTELLVDQQVVSSSRNGKPVEFEMNAADLGAGELTLVAYDRTGVLAVASVMYGSGAGH